MDEDRIRTLIGEVEAGRLSWRRFIRRGLLVDRAGIQEQMGRPDPQRFMEQFTSWQIAQKDNKWALANSTRWKSEDYDRLWKAAESEMDAVKRAGLFIRMNDLVVREGVVITPWGSDLRNLAFWHRQG